MRLALILALTLGLAAALLFAACSPLTLYNTLAPADGDTRHLLSNAAYGPDPRQTLDVFGPPSGGGALPIVIFIYGGSWSSGSKTDYSFAGKAFAARGFLTVVPDYRLVPDFRFPSMVEDIASAVRWVRDNAAAYGGNADRIFLAGHSAGAYNIAMVALDRQFLKAAGVPATAIKGVAGLAGPYDFYPFDVDSTRAAFGRYADPKATQPIEFARRDAPPMFLATGDADETVQPRNSKALAAKLNAAGAKATLRIYPGQTHVSILLALSKPLRHTAPVLDDMAAFFRAQP